jgi:hypothetical protein
VRIVRGKVELKREGVSISDVVAKAIALASPGALESAGERRPSGTRATAHCAWLQSVTTTVELEV